MHPYCQVLGAAPGNNYITCINMIFCCFVNKYYLAGNIDKTGVHMISSGKECFPVSILLRPFEINLNMNALNHINASAVYVHIYLAPLMFHTVC